uniref:Retrovirus-related Pol polyprotein from transposon TNT 1-94 n=1 Tax=Tanacetum cinerariifolium TaxID=118510 RepID=A0A699GMM4_TANCI|nr:hypothetical protein [Tanacetum cinerariifolium]
MATKHLDADLSGTPIDQMKYRSMVRALMYLTTSRPDIMHATCYCARYQAKPTEKHLTVVKQIFRYLKDTVHMGLWYPKDIGFELTAFSDSDHTSCLDLRKSTSGGIQFLGGDKLVSWSSKKQDYYGFYFDTIPMYYDSKAAIAISCNPIQHSRTKHIDVRYHFIKEKFENGIVELFLVGTKNQLANLFTKALPEERFKYLVRRLGMRCLTPDELEVGDLGLAIFRERGGEILGEKGGEGGRRWLCLQGSCMAIRDTESEPEEAPSKTKKFQPPSTRTSPLSRDHTPTSPDYTPDTPLTDEESEPTEATKTRTTSPSDSTTPLSFNHPLTQITPTLTLSRPLYYCKTVRMAVHTQPTMSPVFSAKLTEVMALSPPSFRKRYRSSYETPSSSASPTLNPTLPTQKRYRGTSEPILDTETEDDESEAEGTGSWSKEFEEEGPDSEGWETASEKQQQAVPAEDAIADEPLGLGYREARRRALELAKEIAPSTFEIGQSSRSVPDQQVADETSTPRIPARTTWIDPEDVHIPSSSGWSLASSSESLAPTSPVASLVTTPTTTIAVDEDEFLEWLEMRSFPNVSKPRTGAGAGAVYGYFWCFMVTSVGIRGMDRTDRCTECSSMTC